MHLLETKMVDIPRLKVTVLSATITDTSDSVFFEFRTKDKSSRICLANSMWEDFLSLCFPTTLEGKSLYFCSSKNE